MSRSGWTRGVRDAVELTTRRFGNGSDERKVGLSSHVSIFVESTTDVSTVLVPGLPRHGVVSTRVFDRPLYPKGLGTVSGEVRKVPESTGDWESRDLRNGLSAGEVGTDSWGASDRDSRILKDLCPG